MKLKSEPTYLINGSFTLRNYGAQYVNEVSRKLIDMEYSYLGCEIINTTEAIPYQCSWQCHNNTTYCIKHHTVHFSSEFRQKVDPYYFGLIKLLGSKGSYEKLNLLCLVVLWPILMHALLELLLFVRFKRSKIKIVDLIPVAILYIILFIIIGLNQKETYAYCTDFVINAANFLGLSYYEVNAWIFMFLWPLLTAILTLSLLFLFFRRSKIIRKLIDLVIQKYRN